MVVRSISVHSPANAASGTRTDLWIQALPRLYRITPAPCIDIDFGARPYFFYYSLCINYLLCNDFFKLSLLLLSLVCTIFCAQENDPGTSASLCRSALTNVTTSACRAFRSATSGLAWGMEPYPASSSDHVINTKHINQLSCLHAQSFKFLTCVRLGQALYIFGKKLLVKISLSKLFLWHANSNTPFTWGLPSWSFFLLHMVILVRLRSLFVYYATICTILT